ncbi:flavin monoamine oxidase family protein [Mucilaginibacter celer]|uniref:Tryptophan 2-monooxygenase n=1 Tax=Mucilaginibacter celer TaxID=2305508 RepID=A0A494VTS7_9SPHI|nr:NAD(P)/FAD-dependent oxidoreductase [Mucilaginibacter celer]AYL96850.1 FAD-dependent oxidoreductase [Mucilaginibacter celer]
MENTDIIIIGAGAAGLMAARTLAKAGKNVVLLEARNRLGGRIHTLENGTSLQHAELGAEFIHGDLPITQGLLNEAGIKYNSASASMWNYEDGKFAAEGHVIEHWEEFMERIMQLKHDTNLEDFILQEFPGEKYAGLRESVRGYVAGYDNADPKKASAFSIRKEWQNEHEDAQYRIEGGYRMLIQYLADEFKQAGGHIFTNAVAKDIDWGQYHVTVSTDIGITYQARQLLVAMPLGLLQAEPGLKATISFDPPVDYYTNALKSLGFGAVIKVLLEFDEAFWYNDEMRQMTGADLEDMGFLFTAEAIPVWWTQMPVHRPLLTGWLGGPPAAEHLNTSDEDMLLLALGSISNVFKIDLEKLKEKLLTWNVMNWTADPFSRGSYSYDTVETAEARKILSHPIGDTLFFAGEYLYEGTAMGTVEAALTSGLRAAEMLLEYK